MNPLKQRHSSQPEAAENYIKEPSLGSHLFMSVQKGGKEKKYDKDKKCK